MTPIENPKEFGIANNTVGITYISLTLVIGIILLVSSFNLEQLDKINKNRVIMISLFLFTILMGIISLPLTWIRIIYEKDTNYTVVNESIAQSLGVVEGLILLILLISLSSYWVNSKNSMYRLFSIILIGAGSYSLWIYAEQTKYDNIYDYKNLDQL